jgi:DNA repair protein RadA/Sms
MPINPGICLAGEIGLSGEIRPVTRIEQRISEAAKLGFKQIIIPTYTKGIDFSKFNIEVRQVSRLDEAFRLLFA